jgi:hypothetical protein
VSDCAKTALASRNENRITAPRERTSASNQIYWETATVYINSLGPPKRAACREDVTEWRTAP